MLGCDILIDSDLKPYLLEINSNPAMCIGMHKYFCCLVLNIFIIRYSCVVVGYSNGCLGFFRYYTSNEWRKREIRFSKQMFLGLN